MPMYDLKCSQCSTVFEVFCKYDDKDKQELFDKMGFDKKQRKEYE